MLGRARIRPDRARLYPELRRSDWYSVVDRDPGAAIMQEVTAPLAGYLWLFVQDGKGRHVSAQHFEVELDDDRSRTDPDR